MNHIITVVRVCAPMGVVGSKNADANSLEGGGSLDSVTKVEKILEWCDAHLEEGSFFKDWEPCDHPQLGAVEIGGGPCALDMSFILPYVFLTFAYIGWAVAAQGSSTRS